MSDPEDILNDALTFLGEKQVVDTDILYGPLQLTTAPKEGKANILLADHLFSPSIFLAERIERNLIPLSGRKVIELGAGCALPSLLMSTLSEPPSLVMITDYPDPGILGNLQANITRNRHTFSPSCKVLCAGYDWGTDATALLAPTANTGYDIVILSDLLHFDASHDALVASLQALLAKSTASVAYVAAGKYTLPHVCAQFLRVAVEAGFQFEEVINEDSQTMWLGKLPVPTFDSEGLAVRKAACRFWIGSWA
ncbi:putative methyltransferase-domain-containing protein [Mucidula mucida]|nr:putative methyltransferase-domain-containing protein [Mucidula mucida]